MKKGIHPKYNYVKVTCTNCGATYTIGTTMQSDFTVSVCYNCHPTWTGKQRDITRVSQVAKFLERQKKAQERAKQLQAKQAK